MSATMSSTSRKDIKDITKDNKWLFSNKDDSNKDDSNEDDSNEDDSNEDDSNER